MSSLIASDTAVIGIVTFFAVVIALVCAAYVVHVRALARKVRQSQELRRRAAAADLREDTPAPAVVHLRAGAPARRAHRETLGSGILTAERRAGGS